MKKIFALVAVFTVLLLSVGMAEPFEKIWEQDALIIVGDAFDTLYPGLTMDEKQWLWTRCDFILNSGKPSEENSWQVSLTYKNVETISVSIRVGATSGEILFYTPRDLAAMIHSYEQSLSLEKAISIARERYAEELTKVCAEQPDAARAFLSLYGENALDPDQMVGSGLWVSPLNVGAKDGGTYWQIFLSHPCEIPSDTQKWAGYDWYYVCVDATTGEILDTGDTSEFFKVRPYLFR